MRQALAGKHRDLDRCENMSMSRTGSRRDYNEVCRRDLPNHRSLVSRWFHGSTHDWFYTRLGSLLAGVEELWL